MLALDNDLIYEFNGFKVRYELKLMVEDETVLNQ